MSFKVVESFCVGKWGDDRCEDMVHVSQAFVAVIDGASSASSKPGKTPGRIMAELVDEALQFTPAEACVDEALRFVNAHVRGALGYLDDRDVLSRGSRPAAAAVILSQARKEVWSVGDGWVVRDGVPERLEIAFAEPYTYLRCAYVDAQLRAGRSSDHMLASSEDWDLIRPFLELQPGIQNNLSAGRYAYGVLDGSDSCIPFARVFDVSGASDVALASDGYPVVGSALAETEARLAEILVRDPLMIELYPQCKPVRPGQISYDDRSYVRLSRPRA